MPERSTGVSTTLHTSIRKRHKFWYSGCIYIQNVQGKKGRFRSFKFGALPTLLPFNLRSDAVWITFRNIVVMETHEKIKIIIIQLHSISVRHLVVCKPWAIVFTILVLQNIWPTWETIFV